MNETALKDRLKKIALESNRTFNHVWKQLLLERFLSRLSSSSYQDKFIFKGGLLLAQYISIKRETIDIDFLMTKIKTEEKKIEEALKQVVFIDSEDGFSFSWYLIEELSQPHMEYDGFRVTLDVRFGKMRDKIQIDVGVGDIVDPVEAIFKPFEYRGKPIFSGEISLYVYPPEAIFSEKLETIISKGAVNSRMKDYHDLILMTREPNFLEDKKLSKSIKNTFSRRKTEMKLFIDFDQNEVTGLQSLWNNHLKGLGIFRDRLNLPDKISSVINEINNWITLNKIMDMN